jgi:hypothetical protein
MDRNGRTAFFEVVAPDSRNAVTFQGVLVEPRLEVLRKSSISPSSALTPTLETYTQGGRGVVTSRVYLTDDALSVKVFCDGPSGVTLLGLEVLWKMGTLWEDKV